MEGRFETFTVLIGKINRCIKKIKTEEMDEMNLKSPHVSCLYYLYRCGELTAKELGDICGEDKAALSRSLVSLENDGYILCDDKNKKRYRSYLKLSEKGIKTAEKIANIIEKMLNLASEGLSDEKRKIMYEGLTLICNNLDNFCKKYDGDK